MSLRKISLSVCLISLLSLGNAQATNKALLIGVNDYEGTENDLKGPSYDITALKSALMQYWGFDANNIAVLGQQNGLTPPTKKNILDSLRALVDGAKAGDNLFIYFSGHGTSRHDKKLRLPLPYSSGALIPSDFSKQKSPQEQIKSLIVGKDDLRPILNTLDSKQAKTWIVFDSCYSGEAVRTLNSTSTGELKERFMPLMTRGDFDDPEPQTAIVDTSSEKPEAYPYQNILFLAAANTTERAKDIGPFNLTQYNTIDSQPHGAFTDALLRIMNGSLAVDINQDGQLTYDKLYQTVHTFMKDRGYGHDPQVLPTLAEDKQLLRTRSVLQTKPGFELKAPKPAAKAFTLSLQNLPPPLLTLFQQMPGVQIVESKADVTVLKQQASIQLINKAGDRIATLDNPSPDAVVKRVQQEAWFHHFKEQLSQRPTINVHMSLRQGAKGSTVVEKEQIGFSLKADQSVYLMLLDIDADGNMVIVYPINPSEQKPIPAKELSNIPDEPTILVKAPFGVDHVIAIGFKDKPAFWRNFDPNKKLSPTDDDAFLQTLQKHLTTEAYGFSTLDLISLAATANTKNQP